MDRRRAAALLAVAPLAALAAFGSCTTFDGLSAIDDTQREDTSVPARPETGTDARTLPDVPVESGPSYISFLSKEDAARLCTLVFRCSQLGPSILQSVSVPVDSLDYSSCMDFMAGPVPPDRIGISIQSMALSCVAKATTCLQAGACLALEQFDANDARCTDAGPDAAKERCIDDGGTVLRCNGNYALHCSSPYYGPGSKCMTGSDKSHWCATATNCNMGTSCVGSLLDYCGAGSNLHEAINCAANGYTCGLAPDASSPDCLTSTTIETCAAVGTDCAGDFLTVCDGYQISKLDCAALGGTCSKKAGSARCVRAADTCTPADPGVNACNGNVISLCIGGAKSTFDCASVGLSCKPAAGAQTGHCG